MRYNSEETIEKEKFGPVEGVSIDPVDVYVAHHQAMFVGSDESIMGTGFRVQGTDNDVKMRTINRPDECKDYKKVIIGKFFRLIFTKSGKLFFNG